MYVYYKFLLLKTDGEISQLREMHPMECKKLLAEELCARFHGSVSAEYEREQFEKVFSANISPDDMPSFSVKRLFGTDSAKLIDILVAANLFQSKREIRRLFDQGAVKINGSDVDEPSTVVSPAGEKIVVQVGKRVFVEITQ
jgi:tyrosyl-tRNA synthetase